MNSNKKACSSYVQGVTKTRDRNEQATSATGGNKNPLTDAIRMNSLQSVTDTATASSVTAESTSGSSARHSLVASEAAFGPEKVLGTILLNVRGAVAAKASIGMLAEAILLML